jgi:hypothetical protein
MESILSSILPAWLLEKTSTISQTQLIFSLGTLAVLLIQIFGQAVRFFFFCFLNLSQLI